MKVTLLTASSKDYWSLLELSAPNKLEYCLRHGVQLSVAVHERLDPAPNWGEREQFMRDALDSFDADWLWFMGADTLITNMTVDIRELCQKFEGKDFVIGVDINGINNDSFLLKNSKASRDFLNRVMCRRDHGNDQTAMFAEMKTAMTSTLVNQRMFNSFKYDEYHYGDYELGDWQPGDFVIHFPGMSVERRLDLMKDFIANKITRS